MAVRGTKPGARGVSNNRHRPVHDWVEVERLPFEGGPELPEVRSDGRAWPEATKAKWDAWRSMPHCKLWGPEEWAFARDSIELAAEFHKSFSASHAAELRNRERVLGTTAEYRRDIRIRYIDPRTDNETTAGVTRIADYHRSL
jgi:hypothetical protein